MIQNPQRYKVWSSIIRGVICVMKVCKCLKVRRFAILLLVFSAFYVLVSTVIFSVMHHFSGLYWDQIDDFAAFFYAQKAGRIDQWVFGPHNEHIIAVPRLLFLIDWTVFGAKGVFLKILMFLVQGGMVSLFWFLTKDAVFSINGRFVFLACAIIAMFSFAQYENFDSTFQIQFLLVYFFAQSSFSAVYFSKAKGGSILFVCLAIYLSLCASLTMANGLMAGVLLVVPLIVNRNFICAIVSILMTVFVYAVFYEKPISGASFVVFSNEGFLKNFLDLMSFVLVYLGNPLGRMYSLYFAKLLVGANLFCLAGVFIFAWRKIGVDKSVFVGVSILFVFLSACATAAGRIHYGGDYQALSGRYATPALYFWLLSVFFYLLVLYRLKPFVVSGRIKVLFMTVPCVYFFILVAGQHFDFLNYRKLYEHKKFALSSVKVGSIDRNFHKYIHPNGVQRVDAFRFLKTSKYFSHVYNQKYPSFDGVDLFASVGAPSLEVGMMNGESIFENDTVFEVFGNARLFSENDGGYYVWDENVGWVGLLNRVDSLGSIWPYIDYSDVRYDLMYGYVRNISDVRSLWLIDSSGNCLAKILPTGEYLYKTSYLRDISGYNGNDCEWESVSEKLTNAHYPLPPFIKNNAVTSIIFNTYSSTGDVVAEESFWFLAILREERVA